MGTKGLVIIEYYNKKCIWLNKVDSYPAYLGQLIIECIKQFKNFHKEFFGEENTYNYDTLLFMIINRLINDEINSLKRMLIEKLTEKEYYKKVKNEYLIIIDSNENIKIDENIDWEYRLDLNTLSFFIKSKFKTFSYDINDINENFKSDFY